MDKKSLDENPIKIIKKFEAEAKKKNDPLAGYCILATGNNSGNVFLRTIELDEISENKLIITLSSTSPKYFQLKKNKNFEILLLRMLIPVQIRIKGKLIKADKKITEEKWQKTYYNYKILDWYHKEYQKQSRIIKSYDDFLKSIIKLKTKFPEKDIKIPDTVIGYYIIPQRIEVWNEKKKNKIPERKLYELKNNRWKVKYLVP